jgi:hypothetical protein
MKEVRSASDWCSGAGGEHVAMPWGRRRAGRGGVSQAGGGDSIWWSFSGAMRRQRNGRWRRGADRRWCGADGEVCDPCNRRCHVAAWIFSPGAHSFAGGGLELLAPRTDTIRAEGGTSGRCWNGERAGDERRPGVGERGTESGADEEREE